MLQTFESEFGDGSISIQAGQIARQANGSVIVRNGGSVVISTATSDFDRKMESSFFPLTVDYREKSYAAGKIPGGYFKREGRPTDKETLTCRLIDRPVRPLFPKGFKCSTHLVNFVLSHDQEHEPNVLAVLGASCALMISDIPFLGPISPVKVGRLDGKFIANPTCKQLEDCDLNIMVVSSETSIVMVEGGSTGLPEDVVVEALRFAFEKAQPLNELQRQMVAKIGKEKKSVEVEPLVWCNPDGDPVDPEPLFETNRPKILEALKTPGKKEMYAALKSLSGEMEAHFDVSESANKAAFHEKFSELEREVARQYILRERKRADGRTPDEIRSIWCEVDFLPRTHGSAVFTRGQTQALVTLTLGTTLDEQKIDDLDGEIYKSFMLHYNFPPFSVGETGFIRGPGRREVGHGALAERSISPIIPKEDDFPYTIRIVSEIMESNGSSSMASVCGASLSLMDGGVPIKSPVAGIAMGLVLEGDSYAVLSDISGLEDHLGDMDFKIAGTKEGITAIQMDIKLTGFKFEILEEALEQARKGRLAILDKMIEAIATPRTALKPYAPRIHIMKINPEKIGSVVGPGGKIIRALTAETGTKIELDDDGTVKISSSDLDGLQKAVDRVSKLTEEATINKDYSGIVRRIEAYGAFIEILPGTDGLLHVSRMANYRVNEVEDEMHLGDEVMVRVVEIDRMGKVKLSRQELMEEGKVKGKKPPESDSGGRNSYSRNNDRQRGGYSGRGSYRDRNRSGSPGGGKPYYKKRDDRGRDDRGRDNRGRDNRGRDNRGRDDRQNRS